VQVVGDDDPVELLVAERPGGAVLQVCCHNFDIPRGLFGQPANVAIDGRDLEA
jgi:predicted dehydrogenase